MIIFNEKKQILNIISDQLLSIFYSKPLEMNIRHEAV